MTKRRPSNKKPSGLNKTLGNSLINERQAIRKSHHSGKYKGTDIESAAFMEKEEMKHIDSVTDETSLEEFLAKAQLADADFTAERQQYRLIENNSAVVVPTRVDLKNNIALQREFAHRLRIPRRPRADQWNSVEELTKLENDNFLRWRTDLSDLQEVDGLTLTPYERNPDMWRELWRVVERSDIVVQIVDARNPLLFRSSDLDNYVKEVDPAKQILLLVNKADLLEPEQQAHWSQYFKDAGINAVFWSALESEGDVDEDMPGPSEPSTPYLNSCDDLIALLKSMGKVSDEPGAKGLVVGMVGYPNVGKSSTINKLVGSKKVSVSATPGKTRHFQTIHLDSQLCLCDCPGLVMPSFAFGREEMFLNGILPVDQMKEKFAPTALLLSRVPSAFLEHTYSIMLPDPENPSPVNLLTCIAFMRGFMSASGIPDCSRSARLLIKDVVAGKTRWVAAPPSCDQTDFNDYIYKKEVPRQGVGKVQLEQLERRGLLDGENVGGRRMDTLFFKTGPESAHVRSNRGPDELPMGSVIPHEAVTLRDDKKHFNRNKREKARRVFVQTYS